MQWINIIDNKLPEELGTYLFSNGNSRSVALIFYDGDLWHYLGRPEIIITESEIIDTYCYYTKLEDSDCRPKENKRN